MADEPKPVDLTAEAQDYRVDEVLTGLSKNMGARPQIKYGAGYSDVQASSSAGDVRNDQGSPIDLRVPSGYRAQVKKVLEFYGNDPLFAALIRRFWEFGNTRFDWVVPAKDKASKEQAADEQGFWNHWSSRINMGVSHVMPGIDTINVGMFKSLLLSAMDPMHWSWGHIPYKGKSIWAPVRMRIDNPMSVVFSPGRDGNVSAFLKLAPGSSGSGAKRGDPGAGDGQSFPENTARFQRGGNTQDLRKSREFRELRYGTSFIIRYEHASIDARVNRTGGMSYETAGGLDSDQHSAAYPEVPYISLLEAITLRRGLAATDMRLIDGIINFMLIWKVGNGDKDGQGRLINLPRPPRLGDDGKTVKETSTIDTVKKWLETGENMDVAEWVLPYWVAPEILMPDTAALLNTDKYNHATNEILQRFGIFLGKDANNREVGKMNAMWFEAQIEHVRQTYIARFWEMLARRIIDHPRNAGVFKSGDPNFQWRPLQTRMGEWREQLVQIAKMGGVSWETIWRAMTLNPASEGGRIMRENSLGLTNELKTHTPVQFSQTMEDPDGNVTQNDDGGNLGRGRPKKTPGAPKKE